MPELTDEKPHLTPLVIGLTRPPMMWGIPLNAFYIIVGFTLIAFLLTAFTLIASTRIAFTLIAFTLIASTLIAFMLLGLYAASIRLPCTFRYKGPRAQKRRSQGPRPRNEGPIPSGPRPQK